MTQLHHTAARAGIPGLNGLELARPVPGASAHFLEGMGSQEIAQITEPIQGLDHRRMTCLSRQCGLSDSLVGIRLEDTKERLELLSAVAAQIEMLLDFGEQL